MRRIDERPRGLELVAALIALSGITSLLGAWEIVQAVGHFSSDAVPSVLFGLLLLHRAYALASLHRGAWLTTVALVAISAVNAARALLIDPTLVVAWVNLGLAVGVDLYLTQRGVRRIFARDHTTR